MKENAVLKLFDKVSDFFDRLFSIGERNENITKIITAAVFVFVYPLSAVYCVITAFDLNVSHAAVVIGCLIEAAVLTALYKKKYESWVYIAAGAAVLVIAACFARDMIAAVSYTISWGFSDILPESEEKSTAMIRTGCTMMMLLAALFPGADAARMMLRDDMNTIASFMTVGPFVALSIIVEDNCADTLPLVTVTACSVILLLTGAVYKHSTESGAALAMRLAPAALALTILLAVAVSPDSYVRRSWDDILIERLSSCTGLSCDGRGSGLGDGIDPNGVWKPNGNEIDMSEIGPNHPTGEVVMSVNSSTGGTMYLRAVSYPTFRNNTWLPMDADRAEYISGRLGVNMVRVSGVYDETYRGNVQIQYRYDQDFIFTPYYPCAISTAYGQYGDGYLENYDGARAYSVDFCTMPEPGSEDYRDIVYSDCLDIDDYTKQQLLQLAQEAGITGLPHERQPEAVAEYVSGCAEYSLDTPHMPKDADFAVWFLTEAKTGYCMHFATTAALMLRALDIPSRYVTGIVAETRAQQWCSVTDNSAHAWVEYYDPEFGWRMLEATPSGAGGGLLSDGEATETSSTTTTTTTTTTTATNTTDSGSGQTERTEPPTQPDGSGEKKSGLPKRLVDALAMLALCAAAFAAVAVSRRIRLAERSRRFAHGDANERAIEMWTYIARVCAELDQPEPESIKDIILKARFSQHMLTDSELDAVSACAENACEALKKRDDQFTALINKYIKALY